MSKFTNRVAVTTLGLIGFAAAAPAIASATTPEKDVVLSADQAQSVQLEEYSGFLPDGTYNRSDVDMGSDEVSWEDLSPEEQEDLKTVFTDTAAGTAGGLATGGPQGAVAGFVGGTVKGAVKAALD